MRILIEKGHLLDPANVIDKEQDLYIADGKIIAHGKKPYGFNSDITINAKNKLVLPGLIDLCARLREPGQTQKGTLKTELLAANKSGITSVCCPPDTKPVIDSPAVVELINQRARDISRANVYLLGALTQNLKGQQLAEMFTLQQAGCVGISNALAAIENTEVLLRAFEYAKDCGLTVHFFSEDHALKNNGVVHEGAISTRLGLPSISEIVETIAISRALLLIEKTSVRVHFCRLSCASSMKMIKQAKKQGLPVTADVAICNLHLTEMDVIEYNPNFNLTPPLRSEGDRRALIKGVADSTIDAVCSDHQPHDNDAKASPFSNTEPGASTIEYLLPLMLHLVGKEELSLEVAIKSLTSVPSEILNIDKGSLKIDDSADVCIVDINKDIYVDKNTLLSAGKNFPFHGWGLRGLVTHTIFNGKLIFEQE